MYSLNLEAVRGRRLSPIVLTKLQILPSTSYHALLVMSNGSENLLLKQQTVFICNYCDFVLKREQAIGLVSFSLCLFYVLQAHNERDLLLGLSSD